MVVFTITALPRFALCRLLRPPPALAAEWAGQREALLHRVMAALVGGGGGSRQAAARGATAAEADAVPAAACSTQELLVRTALQMRVVNVLPRALYHSQGHGHQATSNAKVRGTSCPATIHSAVRGNMSNDLH